MKLFQHTMRTISTTLSTSAPVLAETVEDLRAVGQDVPSVLADFSTAATNALAEYAQTNPAPKPGQDVPFMVRCTKEDAHALQEALDGIFMDDDSEKRARLLEKYGIKELRRRQGILYSFCFDLERYFGI